MTSCLPFHKTILSHKCLKDTAAPNLTEDWWSKKKFFLIKKKKRNVPKNFSRFSY